MNISSSYITNKIDDEVVRLLKSGGIGFMPSDTIYGLSCQALNEQAVERLHRIKLRDDDKPFIVLISDLSQLKKLGVSDYKGQLIDMWPAALTIVFNAPNAPAWLTRGQESLAIRMPNNEELLDLISQTGPLVSTSANESGGEPAHNCQSAIGLFGDKLDLYVDTGELAGQPSTIVKLENGQVKILRQGAVKIN